MLSSGSDVDIGLSLFGHCNYLSPRHACIFYNKVHTFTHTLALNASSTGN